MQFDVRIWAAFWVRLFQPRRRVSRTARVSANIDADCRLTSSLSAPNLLLSATNETASVPTSKRHRLSQRRTALQWSTHETPKWLLKCWPCNLSVTSNNMKLLYLGSLVRVNDLSGLRTLWSASINRLVTSPVKLSTLLAVEPLQLLLLIIR